MSRDARRTCGVLKRLSRGVVHGRRRMSGVSDLGCVGPIGGGVGPEGKQFPPAYADDPEGFLHALRTDPHP